MMLPQLHQAIDAVYLERRKHRKAPGTGIGGSQCGHPCVVHLAFALRDFPQTPVEPRILRIFELGQVIEDVVIGFLREALAAEHPDVELLDKDPATGDQWVAYLLDGHMRVHPDGLLRKDGYLVASVEIKSANDKKFQEFARKGVKGTNAVYYGQAQIAMYCWGAPTCLFLIYNKNTSECLIEYIERDNLACFGILANVEAATEQRVPRTLAADNFTCRFCNYRHVCREGVAVEPSCGRCQHSQAAVGGGWWCHHKDAPCGAACNDFTQWTPET